MAAGQQPDPRRDRKPRKTLPARVTLTETTEQHLRINRRHRRIGVDIPCAAGLPGQDLAPARLRNLSIGGLKFECGQALIRQFLPQENRTPGMVEDVMLEVEFRLPDDAQGETPVKTRARLAHYERLAQDRFHVGLQFRDISDAIHRKLDAYIDQCIAAADAAEQGAD
jgi:c-di-GMP-binding flagellar brake protein YcgR